MYTKTRHLRTKKCTQTDSQTDQQADKKFKKRPYSSRENKALYLEYSSQHARLTLKKVRQECGTSKQL